MPEKFANEAATVLVGSITSGATSLAVLSSSAFPTTGNFRIRIDNEILIVTNVSGTTWTVTRAAESTLAVAHNNGASVAHILTAGGLVQAIQDSVDIRLDYTAAVDLHSGTTVPANTWTDLGANQSFTVVSASSVIEIAVRGMALVGNSGTINTEISSRIVIDSAGTPITRMLGGDTLNDGGAYINPLSSSGVNVTGLTPGTHTIKTQVLANVASTLICRPATFPNSESYAIQVTEMAG